MSETPVHSSVFRLTVHPSTAKNCRMPGASRTQAIRARPRFRNYDRTGRILFELTAGFSSARRAPFATGNVRFLPESGNNAPPINTNFRSASPSRAEGTRDPDRLLATCEIALRIAQAPSASPKAPGPLPSVGQQPEDNLAAVTAIRREAVSVPGTTLTCLSQREAGPRSNPAQHCQRASRAPFALLDLRRTDDRTAG